jgi:hypothetical protein
MTKMPIEDQFKVVREQLVERTAEKIYPFNMPDWEHLFDNPYETSILGTTKKVSCPGKNYYRCVAKEMLAEAYPEIDWD